MRKIKRLPNGGLFFDLTQPLQRRGANHSTNDYWGSAKMKVCKFEKQNNF